MIWEADSAAQGGIRPQQWGASQQLLPGGKSLTATEQEPNARSAPQGRGEHKRQRQTEREREAVFLLPLFPRLSNFLSSFDCFSFLITAEQSNRTPPPPPTLSSSCAAVSSVEEIYTCWISESPMRHYNEAVVFNCLNRHMKECVCVGGGGGGFQLEGGNMTLEDRTELSLSFPLFEGETKFVKLKYRDVRCSEVCVVVPVCVYVCVFVFVRPTSTSWPPPALSTLRCSSEPFSFLTWNQTHTHTHTHTEREREREKFKWVAWTTLRRNITIVISSQPKTTGHWMVWKLLNY